MEAVCSWVHMPKAQLFAQPCCSGVTPLETLERIRPPHLEMVRVQMMTGYKLTLSRKVREKAKVKTNSREEIARPTRALQTSINTCKNCGKLGHRAKDSWNPGEGACTELVAALSKCHEPAPSADCLPHSLFKVSFPWRRHLLLSFFNLVLRFAVVPSAWKW